MYMLKKPLVTEKASACNSRGVYGLIVDRCANKIQIRKAVECLYKVKVDKVNTMRYAGKAKTRQKGRLVIKGSAPAYKKVFVTLRAGDVIDFYSNI